MDIKMTGWNLWGIEHRLAKRVLERLTAGEAMSEQKFLKCKLGIEALINNMFKLSIVYAVAFVMNTFLATLFVHLGFLAIRTFAYGAHAKSSVGCIGISTLALVGLPLLIQKTFLFPRVVLLLAALLIAYGLWEYAPGTTAKNKITSEVKKKRLKKRALFSCFLTIVISSLLPLLEANLLLIGNLLAVCCIIPVFIKKGGNQDEKISD